MDENCELLMHIYKDAEMGAYSTKTLLNKIRKKENKITTALEHQIKEYESFKKKSEKLLKKYDITPKGSGLMTKMSSMAGITMETLRDNTDASLAKLLIQGLTMGIVSVTTKISQYVKVCDKKIIKMANNFKEFQENEINVLKTFM